RKRKEIKERRRTTVMSGHSTCPPARSTFPDKYSIFFSPSPNAVLITVGRKKSKKPRPTKEPRDLVGRQYSGGRKICLARSRRRPR
uniref:Uncharacterized protein n=1 Tax=Aegilops tauschii subsp. strangulata TaxID=200361 RepID=A0A453FDM9_AEGTS